MEEIKVMSVKELMEILKREESINERMEHPIQWVAMAWEVDHNLYLANYDDRNEKKLILTPNERNALRTIYPYTTFAKMIQTTKLWENYGQWIVWSFSGQRLTCWVSREGVNEWKKLNRIH